MSDLAAAQAALRTTFGFDAFRPGQADIIGTILAGRDVLAVMPTGSGKSLCYQLPALIRRGLTVVVSPLIALMRNQVAQLRGYGIAAASLNSANDFDENRQVFEQMARGELRLLYVAPERLAKSDTIALLKRSNVGLLAVDEAHCISQWGHDFRPEYLSLGNIQAALGGVQTIALTATADAGTRTDILDKLFRREPAVFVHGFDRPNLRLTMRAKAGGRQADRRFPQGTSRRERHHLLQLAQEDGGTRRVPARARLQGAALSRRAGRRHALASPGRLPAGRWRGDGRHRRLRHGYR